jgi:hypothetical protein
MSTDTLALPLDRARAKLFTSALRVGVLRSILLEKRRRIPALLVAHALVALVGAVLAPTALLVLGPLLLGVPHLVSDMRYLVLRPRVTRGVRAVLFGGAALVLALRVAHELGQRDAARVEPVVVSGWLLIALLALARGRDRWRVAVALTVPVGFALASWLWPSGSRLCLAHGHNVVALGLWVWGFARERLRAALLSLVFVALGVTLLATPLAWYGFKLGVQHSFGLHSFAAADTLAPGALNVTFALGAVASFAFLQSLHYAVWLHAIPQGETRGEATLSFRMSLRQLRCELGVGGLWLAALLTLAVPVAAVLGPPCGTKDLYISLSSFHAYLELVAALVFFLLKARPSSMSTACS